MKQQLHQFFEKSSVQRPVYRKKRSYYWDSITRFIDFYAGDDLKVLEIGCGTGELIGNIKGKDKSGIDFSQGMLDLARERYPDVNFIRMDAEHLELDDQFDLIIISNLVGVLIDVQSFFESLKPICHSKTKLIVTHKNYVWEPITRLGEVTGLLLKKPNESWLSKHDLQNLLSLAGFEVYQHTRDMIFPFKIPLISAFLNNFFSRLPIINHLGINHYHFARPVPFNPEKEYSVSIVIPARNESGHIHDSLARLPQFGANQELIYIEGNSTDDTWEVIQKLKHDHPDKNIIVAQQDGKGKGDAVRKGFDLATGDILFILDADLTVRPEDLPKFYEALRSGKGDFINGCRLVYPMEKRAMRPLNLLGNKFFSLAFTWLLGQNIKDTLCGTKVLFRKDYERLIANRSYFGDFDPFGDFDLLFGAYKLNLKIIDLPIRYQERVYGETNISRFTHGWELIKMVVFASRMIKFRAYKLVR